MSAAGETERLDAALRATLEEGAFRHMDDGDVSNLNFAIRAMLARLDAKELCAKSVRRRVFSQVIEYLERQKTMADDCSDGQAVMLYEDAIREIGAMGRRS